MYLANNPARGGASGGIVGWVNTSIITKSKNTGTISFFSLTGKPYGNGNGGCLGGIAGATLCNSMVEQCFNTGTISSKRTDGSFGMNHIGGIVGSSISSTIKNVYNLGEVYGLTNVGGIIGITSLQGGLTGNTYIYNSYNASEMIEGATNVGNFAGALSYAGGSYNSAISGYADAGGMDNSNCFFSNGMLYTLAQMKAKNSELLALLSNGEGKGIWAQDANINDGLPYLVHNRP